jgi:hypothetical protein
MASRSTLSSSFMFLVWMRMTSRRPVSSGTPMSISRSKRPKRLSAGSMLRVPRRPSQRRPAHPALPAAAALPAARGS